MLKTISTDRKAPRSTVDLRTIKVSLQAYRKLAERTTEYDKPMWRTLDEVLAKLEAFEGGGRQKA